MATAIVEKREDVTGEAIESRHWDAIEEAARRIKTDLRALGEALLAIPEEERGHYRALANVRLGIANSMLTVAQRWAEGDMGEDATVEQVVFRIPFSTLQSMTAEAIANTVEGEHVIRTDEGVTAPKLFTDMTRAEISRNVGALGIRPIQQTAGPAPVIRKCIAGNVILDGKEIAFESRGREIVRMAVPQSLLAKATALHGGKVGKKK